MKAILLLAFILLSLLNIGLGQENKHSDFGPDLSPDGTTLVYYSYRNDSLPNIYVLDMDSRQETQLTFNYAAWDLNPKWSVDGQYIYFSSDRAGEMSIFRMDKNGDHLQRVTFPVQGAGHSEISFTADGKTMLYAEFQAENRTAFLLKDLHSGEDKLLLQSAVEEVGFFKPVIHPDGSEVVFLKNSSKDSSYVFDIFKLDVLTGAVENITNTPDISERMPKWSKDGKYLIYSSDANRSSFDLYKCPRAGGKSIQISFFPDKQELNACLTNEYLFFDAGYYGMDVEGNTYIYKADKNGKQVKCLTKP